MILLRSMTKGPLEWSFAPKKSNEIKWFMRATAGALGRIRTSDPRNRNPSLGTKFQALIKSCRVKPTTFHQWVSWFLSNREVPHADAT